MLQTVQKAAVRKIARKGPRKASAPPKPAAAAKPRLSIREQLRRAAARPCDLPRQSMVHADVRGPITKLHKVKPKVTVKGRHNHKIVFWIKDRYWDCRGM